MTCVYFSGAATTVVLYEKKNTAGPVALVLCSGRTVHFFFVEPFVFLTYAYLFCSPLDKVSFEQGDRMEKKKSFLCVHTCRKRKH